MAKLYLDTVGMKCPLPILKLAAMMPKVKTGDLLEITGDCETFEQDIRKWCGQMGKVMLLMVVEAGTYKAQIQF